MRVAYVQGDSGVSGSMLLGALLHAGVSLDAVRASWRALRLPEIGLTSHQVMRPGGLALHVSLALPDLGELPFLPTLCDLQQYLDQTSMSPSSTPRRVGQIVTRVETALQTVYGVPVPSSALGPTELVELLYTGLGVVTGFDELAVEQCVAGPLNLGASAPNPLIAALVRGIPVYGTTVNRARSTVGGVAIVTSLATDFSALPAMTMAHAGYGASGEDGETGVLQLLFGDVATTVAADRIAILEANIDDMNPEFYETIALRLFAQGALDVTLSPMLMKKHRPANKLTVLAPLAKATELSHVMLRETSTFGVRVYEAWRQKLDRFSREVETRYGTVQVKCGILDGQLVQAAPEYDDCKRLALEHDVPVRLVYAEASRLAAPWLTVGTATDET